MWSSHDTMLRINRPLPAEKIRLLIFDLDGTLVDSKVDLANAINAMLRHYGRPELPLERIASYIGDGAPKLVSRALGEPRDEQLDSEAVQYFMAYYREHKLDNTYVYPGMKAALDRLSANGHGGARKMAVLTNKPVNASRGIVEGLGLGPYFFQVYGGNSFPLRKPDPFGALQLAREAGAAPDETVVLGDSQNDVLTARNAGMWSVGLTYGFSPQTLAAAVPDVSADRPDEIPLIFAKSGN
jgi:phosphoglycolate phosphatase